MELILKIVFKFLRSYTYFFLEQPGKVRRIFKTKLVCNFRYALITGNKHIFGFGDHVEMNQLQRSFSCFLLQ